MIDMRCIVSIGLFMVVYLNILSIRLNGKIDFRAAPFVGVSFDDNYINGDYGCAPAVLYVPLIDNF